jgi:hypothetical protein
LTYIIVTRKPGNTKRLIVIKADDDSDDPPIAEFPSEEKAMRAAANVRACEAWGFEIVEVPTI